MSRHVELERILVETAVPRLAALYPTFEGDRLALDSGDYPQEAVEESHLAGAPDESRACYRVWKG